MIPHKDECVMATFKGYVRKVERSIRAKWRPEFYDGLGLFMLTDTRLVFIRNPIKYDKPAKFSGGRFATLADWEYWTNRSNKAIKKGAKEYFVLPLDEIEKVKCGKLNCQIFAKDKEDKYRLTVDAHVGEELEKYKNESEKIMPLICFEEMDELENEDKV